MARSIDGFYSAWLTGTAGNGLALFVFMGGHIAGTDVGGVSFKGRYEYIDGEAKYKFSVKVVAAANTALIQGGETGSQGLEYEVNGELPSNFDEVPYMTITTPLGPVNVKMERISDLKID